MLEKIIASCALLIGPKKTVVATAKEQVMIGAWELARETTDELVSVIRETDIVEFRPRKIHLWAAEKVLGCPLYLIGEGGANRAPERFVWYSADDLNEGRNLHANEKARGVHKDELRSDIVRQLRYRRKSKSLAPYVEELLCLQSPYGPDYTRKSVQYITPEPRLHKAAY